MTRHVQQHEASARGDAPAPADSHGASKVLAAIERPDGQELRIEWASFKGNPYVSFRLWGRDRSGKWWPDPKRGMSVRLAELEQARAAIEEAIRLADRYYAVRQNDRDLRMGQSRSQSARPRCTQPDRAHQPFKSPHERPSWKDAAIPRAEPAQKGLPFDEFG